MFTFTWIMIVVNPPLAISPCTHVTPGRITRCFILGVHASPGPPSFLTVQVGDGVCRRISRLQYAMLSSAPEPQLGINAPKDLGRQQPLVARV